MSKNQRMKKWANDNKILLCFIIATLCLFVSTVTLASNQWNAYSTDKNTGASVLNEVQVIIIVF